MKNSNTMIVTDNATILTNIDNVNKVMRDHGIMQLDEVEVTIVIQTGEYIFQAANQKQSVQISFRRGGFHIG